MVEGAADPGPLRAYELVMAFAARRGEAALRLAMHAALPQVLRVELLHLIRLNFLPEGAHDLAVEADVLFAPFCEDIGNGYYCFAGNARLQLLQGLDPAYRDESIARSVQVARFMLDYLEHERRNVRAVGDRLHSDWIDVERWSALAFAEPALAAGQLAAALAHATASDDVAARVRVGGLASALAAPLARFGALLTYAEGVEALQAGDHDQAIRLFGAIPDRELEVAGIRLKSPRRVLAESIEREAPAPSPAAPREAAEAPVEPDVPTPPERGGIFIVYRRDDAASHAMRLRESLRARFGDRVFADVADIEAAADLLATIRPAIRESAAVVALIGPRWLDSRQSDRRRRIDSGGDFARIQLAEALQSGIQVVPVLVGGAALPRADELPGDLAGLAHLHALELRDTDWEPDCTRLAGVLESERLLAEIARPETNDARRAEIGDRLDRIGDPRPGVGIRSDGTPEFVWREIPPGSVQLEGVKRWFTVERFFIAIHPVTGRQYRAFVDDPQGYRDERWWQDLRHEKEPGAQSGPTGNCPAVNVSWYDAVAYCRWASARLGHELRLPTEWEWQQAATGGDPTRTYPWGREWEEGRANTYESWLRRATAVGVYPAGATPQGVLDMVGNVWEWCLNEYDSPNDTSPRGSARRVVRGGSWNDLRDAARCALRIGGAPGGRLSLLGLRLVCVSPILKS